VVTIYNDSYRLYIFLTSGNVKPVSENEPPSSGRARGVFAISVAADMVAMQIQNLRVYERHGLVEPDRTAGGTRLYSLDDIDRLTRVRELLAEGLNLAGIARVVDLETEVERLRSENRRLRQRTRS
jgi:MerR family transcriptional regulator, heat shock protein HspR